MFWFKLCYVAITILVILNIIIFLRLGNGFGILIMLSLLSVVKPKSTNENTKLTLFLHHNYKTVLVQYVKYLNCVKKCLGIKQTKVQSDHGIWPSCFLSKVRPRHHKLSSGQYTASSLSFYVQCMYFLKEFRCVMVMAVEPGQNQF